MELERRASVAGGDFLETIANFDHTHSVGWEMQPISEMGVEEQNFTTTTLADPPTSTILLILATWLQLLELYDKLFGHIRAILQEMPLDAFRVPMRTIGLRVPGTSLMQGGLSIKIMVQVINHQLESVEALLGLPDEYSVVRRSGTGIGKSHTTTLFSSLDMEVSKLFQTVMEDMSNGAGKATIASLCDNIQEVQRVVGM
ncbi:hypothetical protein INS49_009597 [Diaporthe citri]|uniref:uncharacterized protein n=1 Tax=Diaporthe citri TaxID=83186 RepID=UPI001C7F8AC0|nr:uncharacterized protein INS49_009597 [Diaporthe citri]KAG6361370.1 hypothetical protein INS49_009597 [Diaporthe citri]